MDVNVRQWINKQPHLSTQIFESAKHMAEFKVDMHFVYIRAWKDPDQTRTTLPLISIDEAIDAVLDTWPLAWRAPNAVGSNDATIWKQKDEAKRET